MFALDNNSNHSYRHYGVRPRRNDPSAPSLSSAVKSIRPDLTSRKFKKTPYDEYLMRVMPAAVRRNYADFRETHSESDSAFMSSEAANRLAQVAAHEEAVPLVARPRPGSPRPSQRRNAHAPGNTPNFYDEGAEGFQKIDEDRRSRL